MVYTQSSRRGIGLFRGGQQDRGTRLAQPLVLLHRHRRRVVHRRPGRPLAAIKTQMDYPLAGKLILFVLFNF